MANKTKKAKYLSNNELSAFCTQMAMILKSGIPVTEGLTIMHDDMDNPYSREILQALSDSCDMGVDFAQALQRAGVFPKYMVDMVSIGQESGRLDDVLLSLGNYYEREDAISHSIRSAVTYPLIMIIMMLLVIGVLIIKVLPVFNNVFMQLGSELTGFARSIMDMGLVLSKYSIFFVIVLGVIVVGIIILGNTNYGRRALTRFKSKFFITKKLCSKIAASRFANGMSLMLSSGLDTDQSLEMVYKLVDNEIVQKKIKQCQQKIAEGASFAEAINESEIFSGVYSHMLAVGFKTGTTDVMMQKLADKYEQEIDTNLNSIVSILEPSLVAVLSIIVGMILLSVMLPLMSIMTTIS